MYQTTRGIILNHLRYSDSAIIAKVYTEQYGLQSYIVRGFRNKGSAHKKALFQRLNLVELVATHRENRELHHLKEIRIAHPFRTIPFDITKSAVAQFMNEVLYTVIREEEPNPELFGFIYDSVTDLDNQTSSVADFHLLFLIRLTRYLGFYPKNNYSVHEPYFDLPGGMFSPVNGPEEFFAAEPYSGYISRLSSPETDQSSAISISPAHRRGLLETILNYYRHHIAGIRDFKSHIVLHEVLK